jgi:hypothetical protein
MSDVIVKLEFGDHDYRLVVGDVESEVVPYGEAIEMSEGGKTYLSLCDQDDKGEVVSLLSDWVLVGNMVPNVVTEDVDFEDDGTDEEEDEPGSEAEPRT